MRIQHNIAAMNSYRNYTNNSSALSKNLEKLSSGYKINRAGDDAAGLAISEKMRAQIAGLDQAQANVKDGISLVKTAEGALQEVQDMMNRMVTLATQSANGTYQNEVDRENLQAEVEELKKEINRIADSSNFNGQKLLNGSLSAGGSSTTTVAGELTVAANLQGATAGVEDYTPATKATSSIAFTGATANTGKDLVAGDTITLTFTDSNDKVHEITLTMNDDENALVDANGNSMGTATKAQVTAAQLATAFGNAIKNDEALKELFNVDTTSTSGTLKLESKDTGADATHLLMSKVTVDSAVCDAVGAPVAVTKGVDAFESLDVGSYLTKVGSTGWDKAGTIAAEDAIFEVNGEKFAIVKDEDSAKALIEAMGENVNLVKYETAAATTAGKLKEVINAKTGLAAEVANTDQIQLKASTTTKTVGKGGLTLQIGDTAEDYNQLKVSIDDMHTKALGIADIDIGNIKGAQDAIQTIKDAINTVSSTRGNLGAIQNRLEHTQNNLSVMTENIQDAESTIRDTDIADEMTTYTKNNILLQSAQAMLAQANQMPQGVLQLLQ